MNSANPKRTRIATWVAGLAPRNLSIGIVIAMGAGLLLPAIVGGLALTQLRQGQMDRELDTYINDKAVLLANSLAIPIWNYDLRAARGIIDATLLDKQVVRIIAKDLKQEPILDIEWPDRRTGSSRYAVRKLMMNDDLMGYVEVEVDDGLRRREGELARRVYAFILLWQFVCAFFLILVALRLRVLKPLERLTQFSNQLAIGNFEHPVNWERRDEIGQLARQMNQMRKDLRTSFAELQIILTNIQVGVIFIRDSKIQLANPHAEQLFGYNPGGMQGLPTKSHFIADEQLLAMEARANSAAANTDGSFEEERLLKRLDGSTFWARMRGCSLDAGTEQASSIWVFEDISDRRAAENEIKNLAFYDPLTGLPNRRLLMDRLQQAMVGGARHQRLGALLFVDLDNFKTINDTLGHSQGDLLLKRVAARLSTCIREGDTVARLGGDEFVVMLEDLSEHLMDAATRAETVGEKILTALRKTYQFDTCEIHSTPSMGVTLFGVDLEEGIEEPLKRADLAMYQAKSAGRNTLRFFDPQMQAVVTARATLESDLREALQHEQFQLYYQPQVDGDGRITGAEALIRWLHPTRGLVAPAEFITLAEETGLILPLGEWVLKAACNRLAQWATQPEMAHITLAVNVSARQFRQANFVGTVLSTLAYAMAEPHRLKLELTESLLVEDVEDIIAKMTALRAKGVSFSLDDFGTGYSSLSYLKRLPLEQLKIDQGFVSNILTDPNDAAIAKMVIALGESLGLGVIAEGVETTPQRDFLAQLGCHTYQGYLFSTPLPVDEFESFVKHR